MVLKKDSDKKIEKLQNLRQKANAAGGEKRIATQHASGKLTARERIDLLFDKNTFQEIDQFVKPANTKKETGVLGDGVITGYGKINGRKICCYAQDFTVLGGSLSEISGKKICKLMDLAMKIGSPIIGIIDSGGARIQEGIGSLSGYSSIFYKNVQASGIIPQISIIAGPAAGGATYSPALTDFIFMVDGISQMYITGPDVIRAVTNENISHEELGGSNTHSSKSGVSHFSVKSEIDCFNMVKDLLSYLPQNNAEEPPTSTPINTSPLEEDPTISNILPPKISQPYDMKKIIQRIIDNDNLFEIHKEFAKNIIIGFSKINAQTVGIVAQQPLHMGGVLDIDASVKAARFIRFCDAFNIPILTLIDVPGFMPGVDQESSGIIRHGAKLIYAYAEATVPKISVLIRKAYGGAYIVMSSKDLCGDINFAWPTGEIAVMGAEGAINIIHRKQIAQSKDPETLKTKLLEDYTEEFMSPYIAANKGLIDEVIEPKDTRSKIISALEILSTKREFAPQKKHGTIPL